MSMNAAPEIAFSSEQGKANYAAARRQYPAQAIVDLKTMRDNMAHLVSVVGGPASGTAVMGVVKADAYGHGAVPISRHLCELGAEFGVVAQIVESEQTCFGDRCEFALSRVLEIVVSEVLGKDLFVAEAIKSQLSNGARFGEKPLLASDGTPVAPIGTCRAPVAKRAGFVRREAICWRSATADYGLVRLGPPPCAQMQGCAR